MVPSADINRETLDDWARRCLPDDDAWAQLISHQYEKVLKYPIFKASPVRAQGRQWDNDSLSAWFFWGYRPREKNGTSHPSRFRLGFGGFQGRNDAHFDPTFRDQVLKLRLIDYLRHIKSRLREDPLALLTPESPSHDSTDPTRWLEEQQLAQAAAAGDALTHEELLIRDQDASDYNQSLAELQRDALADLKVDERVALLLEQGHLPPEEDLTVLASKGKTTLEELITKLSTLIASGAPNREALVEALEPGKNRSERTQAGQKKRRNRVDARISRARRKLKNNEALSAFVEDMR